LAKWNHLSSLWVEGSLGEEASAKTVRRCKHDFTVTSGTLFADTHKSLRT